MLHIMESTSKPRVRRKAKSSEKKTTPVETAAAVEALADRHLSASASPDFSRPSKRLPDRLKQKWMLLPEWAREDICTREAAVDEGFKRFGLALYADHAAKSGTSLPQAMASYVNLENQVRADPIGAPILLWLSMNLEPNEQRSLRSRTAT
jgi:hypothetical protein